MSHSDPPSKATQLSLRKARQVCAGVAAIAVALLVIAVVVRPTSGTSSLRTPPISKRESGQQPKPVKPYVENGTLRATWYATPSDSPESVAKLIAGLVVEMATTTAADVHSMRVDLSVLDANASWVTIGFVGANLIEARSALGDKRALQEDLQDRFTADISRMPGAVALTHARLSGKPTSSP